MLEVVFKFCIGLITSVAGFFVLKNLLKSDEKLLSLRNILLILAMTLPTILFYKSEYYITLSILMYCVTSIIYKIIFRLSFTQSFLATGILMAIIGLSDALTSLIFINITTVEKMRTYWYIMILSNLCVAVIAILFSRIKILSNQIIRLLNRVDTKKYINNIVFLALLIIVISTLFYNVSENFTFSFVYLMNILIMGIFLTLSYIFLREQYNYDKLSHEHDLLFEYVENFEDWIETEQLNRHELKNNLGAIRNITKNKKVIEKINDILNDDMNIEDVWVEELKYVPKGVLKGLLYYKMAIAKKKNVQVISEVSPKSTNYIKKLTKKDLKELTQLIGILFDNSIEAAEESKKKMVCIEIYVIDQQLNIVMSNTYEGEINLEEINKKGKSSKGKGRGNGLYFAKKIVNKSNIFEMEQTIINDYFVEKIVINS